MQLQIALSIWLQTAELWTCRSLYKIKILDFYFDDASKTVEIF